MKNIICFFLFTLIFASFNYSQIAPGAKEIGIANSDVALSNDVFALFNNPSGLGQIDQRSIGIYYSPSPFGLKELANGYFAYSEPFDFGSLSLGGMTYGFDLYKESRITLGLAYKYSDKYYFGLSVNYQTVSIQNYGNSNTLFFSVGALAYLSKKIRWGFSLQNLNRASYKNTEDQIPVVIRTGFSYDLQNNISINLALEKDIKYDPNLHFGIDYKIIEYLSIRTGFSNDPSRYSGGIEIHYSYFNLGYSVFTHQDLGLTHQFGVIIDLGTK